MNNIHKIFKNKEDEDKWLKNNVLTVGDLLKFLNTFKTDTVIYRADNQTCILQEIGKNSNNIFKTIEEDKNNIRKNLYNWYKSSYDSKEQLEHKIQQEISEIYKYTLDNGLVLQC